MGTLGFGGVGISRGGGVRKAAPPGSVYRSPQVFEKLWPFKEVVYQGLGVGSAKPSLSERKVENMGHVNYGPYMFDKKVVQETIDPNAKIEYRSNTEGDPHKRKPDISKAKSRQRIFSDEKEGGSTTLSSA